MAHATYEQRINWQEVGDETITTVRELLRLDTRNPPGNEVRAATYLQSLFAAEGIPGEIVGPSPDRGTFIARLTGDGSAPPLLLMSHTDVVAVEPERWTHGPFSGDIVDGFLYGRGALDMKQMVGMEAMTMLLLKRTCVPLKRDVIYMAAADEECGGHAGAGWVVAHRPELIQAEYALNEGGGSGFQINGRRYYPVQTAEKGTVRFRLRTHGRPGHGSVPHEENGILTLATLLICCPSILLQPCADISPVWPVHNHPRLHRPCKRCLQRRQPPMQQSSVYPWKRRSKSVSMPCCGTR